MPEVYQRDFPGKTQLRIWKLEESADDFFNQYRDDHGKQVHEAIRLDKRKREWLGLQFLLRSHPSPLALSYQESGKPVLEQGFISLSHCKDFVALIHSSHPVGIDLQDPVPQIGRIKTKFCRQDELDAAAIAPNPLKFLTRVWSAKEALFKIYGSNVDFRGEMAFSTEDQDHIFLLKEGGMKRHELFHTQLEDVMICICLDLSGTNKS